MSGKGRAKPRILIRPATSQRGYKSGVNRNTSLLTRKGWQYMRTSDVRRRCSLLRLDERDFMRKTGNTKDTRNTKKQARIWATATTLILTLAPALLYAAPEMKRQHVEAVEMLDKATMYSKTPRFLGVTCRTAPVGDVAGLKQVKIGDTLSLGNFSIKVGVIEAVSFSEDLVAKDGRVLVRKGEVQCAVAANERALPYEKRRCDALWVFTPRCRVIRP